MDTDIHGKISLLDHEVLSDYKELGGQATIIFMREFFRDVNRHIIERGVESDSTFNSDKTGFGR